VSWTEISAVAAGLAALVVAAVAVRTLLAARKALRQIGAAAAESAACLQRTSQSAEALLQEASELTQTARRQLAALEKGALAVGGTAEAVGQVNAALRKASQLMNSSIHGVERTVQAHQRRLQDAMEWAATGMELWQRWQAHRQARTDSPEPDNPTRGVDRHD